MFFSGNHPVAVDAAPTRSSSSLCRDYGLRGRVPGGRSVVMLAGIEKRPDREQKRPHTVKCLKTGHLPNNNGFPRRSCSIVASRRCSHGLCEDGWQVSQRIEVPHIASPQGKKKKCLTSLLPTSLAEAGLGPGGIEKRPDRGQKRPNNTSRLATRPTRSLGHRPCSDVPSEIL